MSSAPCCCCLYCYYFFGIHGVTQPVETLVQTFARCRTRRLDVPLALAQRIEPELAGDLRRAHRVRQVLLIREHEEDGIAQLVFLQHSVYLIACLANAIAIVAIDNEDQALRVVEVM